MKKIFSSVLVLFCSLSLFAGIKFGEGDINAEDEILFTVKQDFPGTYNYNSLIYTSVKNPSGGRILSAFPEQMELLDQGKILQIRNRFGIGHLDTVSNTFNWKNQLNTIPTASSRLSPYAVSPDGQWVCYIQKIDYATGFLIVENVKTGKRKTVDPSANFSYDSVPVKWSPDSRVFVYEKKGSVYFCNPDGFLKGLEVSENFRKIGEGTINSICFAGDKNLVYIDDDLIYKISIKEMYTVGLYSNIIGKGSAIGRLPGKFNPQLDIFSCNEFLNGIFVVQNGKFFTSYKMNSPLCDYLDVEYSGPFVDSKASLLDVKIFWANYTIPVAWVRTLPYTGEKIVSAAYAVTDKLQKVIEATESGLPYVSPDGSKFAFYSGNKIAVYDSSNWKVIGETSGEKIVSIIWKDNSNLYLGGEKTIRSWNLREKEPKVVFLSSVENGYFQDNGEIIAEISTGESYVLNKNSYTWTEKKDAKNHKNRLNNGKYRIFCGTTPNPFFDNALYIRTLSGKPVTSAVYDKSVEKQAQKKQVALVFDAIDSAEGLPKILHALQTYKLTGTFFFNGEFIRRYPNETRQIANSDNESASMFFTPSDLNSKEFVINEEFIRRGLARNEDEYFQCTKKEISLLWHAPGYKISESLINYGKKAGYTYVKTDIKHSDSVTLEQAILEKKSYVKPAVLIDEIMSALKINEGGVVPVTVGIAKGTRPEYLYDYLPLLLSAILDSGYEIVPVKMINF